MGVSARAFSELIGESPTNTQNYIGKRNSMPGADYIEKILSHFEHVNPIWLIQGIGEPFTGEIPTASISINTKKTKGSIQTSNNGHNTINNFSLDDCRRDLEASRKEVELLRSQVQDKERIIQLLEMQLKK